MTARTRVPCAVRVRDAAVEWQIAVERPVEIGINGVPFAVLLATPADLADLARGVAHTEHWLHDDGTPHDAPEVVIAEHLDGLIVDLRVPEARVHPAARITRTLEGRSGCGLCGIESLAALRTRTDAGATRGPCSERAPIDDATLLRAFAALPASQPLNAATHSVHAAAWCGLDGTVLLAREDVGRHNALDKLVGARRADAQLAHAPGFVVMSSRLSYELVFKAHAAGAHCLATVSAPTSLALTTARLLGLDVACLAPAGADGGRGIARFGDGARREAR